MAARTKIDAALHQWAAAFNWAPHDPGPWYGSLATVSDDDLTEAARWIVNSDQQFPKPARIHEVIRMNRRRNQPDTAAQPSVAPADKITALEHLRQARAALGDQPRSTWTYTPPLRYPGQDR